MHDFVSIFLEALIQTNVQFVTGYPGYPVSSILKRLSEVFRARYTYEWAVNEKIAVEMCMGASYSGVRAVAIMKNHGMNTVIDQLTNFAYLGVRGGVLIVVGDDIRVRASQNRTDSRSYGPLTGMPVFEPTKLADVIKYLPMIFNFSEKWNTPVIYRFTDQMFSMTTDITPTGCPLKTVSGNFIKEKNRYLLGPINFQYKKKEMEDRLTAIREQNQCRFNTLELKSRKQGIIVSGTLYENIRTEYPDASILKVILCYPLCMAEIYSMVNHLTAKEIHLAETTDGIIRNQVLPWCYEQGISVIDAASDLISMNGDDVTADTTLCPACPHRAVLIALKELNLDVMGDAGCSALGYFLPYQAVHCQASMSSSIGIACGVNAVASRKAVALIGDSAFYHGGINALLQAASCNSDVLVILSDNGIAAMTGGQVIVRRNTGDGNMHFDLQLLCAACGIKSSNIAVTHHVYDISLISNLIRKLYCRPGTKVLILHGSCIYSRDKPQAWMVTDQEFPWDTRQPPALDRLPYAQYCPACQPNPKTGEMVLTEAVCGPCRICYIERQDSL